MASIPQRATPSVWEGFITHGVRYLLGKQRDRVFFLRLAHAWRLVLVGMFGKQKKSPMLCPKCEIRGGFLLMVGEHVRADRKNSLVYGKNNQKQSRESKYIDSEPFLNSGRVQRGRRTVAPGFKKMYRNAQGCSARIPPRN